MEKKYWLPILVFLFTLGTIVAALPPVEASSTVRFYVWRDSLYNTNIYPSRTVGTTFAVEVWVDSPVEWRDTTQGIVGYALSVRVDPRALEVVGASKIAGAAGFLEAFLVEYGYDLEYSTAMLVGPVDKESGTIMEVSEYILGYKTLGVGAGGGPYKLMRFSFKSRSATIASPIDIWAPKIVDISAVYTTPDGVHHYVDVMDDGYYIGATPDLMWVDLASTLDFAAPVDSKWVELWPNPDTTYTLSSWVDMDGNNMLSVPDIIDLTNDGTGEVTWWRVDWLDTTPTANDKKTDMSLTKTAPVPEFPLGLGIMMLIAPAIPIVYLWRTRKRMVKP